MNEGSFAGSQNSNEGFSVFGSSDLCIEGKSAGTGAGG